MLLSTVELSTEYQVLGLVKGSCIRARHLGQDLLAELRKLFGGEVTEYASLLAEARRVALAEMEGEARAMGANAIVGVRLATSTVTKGAAEVIAYGTAVKL